MKNYVESVRTSKRMTRQRLADLSGTTVKAIVRLEGDRGPPISIVLSTRILQALGIPLSRYRTVFPSLPYEPNDVSMPTGAEIAAVVEGRSREEARRALVASRRARLLTEQDAVRARRRR